MKIFKALITVLSFVIISNISFGQDTIYWSPSYKLKWEDFQGKPVIPSKYGAVSNPIIKYSLSANEDSYNVKVLCFFIKSRSWSQFKNSDTLLMHEQGHFDIAEIFARKLNKSIGEYQFNKNTFQKDLDAIYKSVVDEKEKYQQQYDDETDYSRNKSKQEEWFKKIESELKQNKSWAGY